MRILLASNSPYYPSHGGGNKSNRLLMEALAGRGHRVRVATRTPHFGPRAYEELVEELASRGVSIGTTDGRDVHVEVNGVDVRILSRAPSLRAYFSDQINGFDPDVILTSTDDPAHLMLETALGSPRARVVYLIRATVALPFGPDSALKSAAKTSVLRHADGAVGVSEYVAAYARRWGRLDAIHVPISLLDTGPYPCLGRFENRYVTMVNPCAVKGISIFLALASRLPSIEFAAVPTWGTTEADLARLQELPNVTTLPPVDDFDEILRATRVMLVPSLWAEARSRVILEAMSRGIPVLASRVGGLAEAKLGVDYLLPVSPVVSYRPLVDELMVPVGEIPRQDVSPWLAALQRLVSDRAHYEELSAQSRRAALEYAATLSVLPLEAYLDQIVCSPSKRAHAAGRGATVAASASSRRPHALSAEKRKLLALRLRRKPAAGETTEAGPE